MTTELDELRKNKQILLRFLDKVEEQDLATSGDAKALVKNVRKIINGK